MARYKLWLPTEGEYIYEDGGALVYVGESAADAIAFYLDEWLDDDPEFWVHPEILRGRIVYARDIENVDCHEGAQAGDTTFDQVTSDPERALRPLEPGEIRTWPRGTWRPHWSYGLKDYVGPSYQATVAGESLGEFESREAARGATEAKCSELVAAWRTSHPEYRGEVPADPDEVAA